jgi:hypothetical protein
MIAGTSFEHAEFGGLRVSQARLAPYGAAMTSASPPAATPRCPVAHGIEFDPLDSDAAADPMPWLRAAQREAPVFYLPGYKLWCVTRYDDVIAVLRDTDTYSSRKTISLAKLPRDLLAAFPDGPPDHVLVSLDPPEHTRLRQLAQKALPRYDALPARADSGAERSGNCPVRRSAPRRATMRSHVRSHAKIIGARRDHTATPAHPQRLLRPGRPRPRHCPRPASVPAPAARSWRGRLMRSTRPHLPVFRGSPTSPTRCRFQG